MPKPRTHYDNLKVPRTASAEEIRAAYKTLARKYHPDRNPKSTEATRIMQIINASYDVLSDPGKRASHDLWISGLERDAAFAAARASAAAKARANAPRPPTPRAASPRPRPTQPVAPPWSSVHRAPVAQASVGWGSVLLRMSPIIIFLIFKVALDYDSPPRYKPSNSSNSPYPRYSSSEDYFQPPPERDYRRPDRAPNGASWPRNAGEIPGYPVARNAGHSTVMVNNLQGTSDVFVKLVNLDDASPVAAGYFFVPAYRQFQRTLLGPGLYELRFKDLETGKARKSVQFELSEPPPDKDPLGGSYLVYPLITPDGRPNGLPISPSEF